MPSITTVKNWYKESFEELVNFPLPEDAGLNEKHVGSETLKTDESSLGDLQNSPELIAYNTKFMECIENIKKRHDPVAVTIAKGIQELLRTRKFSSHLPTDIQQFLDTFYMSRIGIRMLIGQHVALSKASMDIHNPPEDYVGIICTNTSIKTVIRQAAESAQDVLSHATGLISPPQIKIFMGGGMSDVKFMYVPSHLHHMIFELLKNSLRAVVERFGDEDYPDIKVVVAQGNEDITIKISDEGGGIPRSGMPLIWTYLYTTAQEQDMDSVSNGNAPLAGYDF